MEKLVVTAAVVGGITIPTQTPYLPITPQQIADEAIASASAGAACVHIHARNPADGRPTVDLPVFKEIITRIKEHSDVVIGLSTGVGAGFGPQERIKAIPAFRPELASCNMGSSCLSARPLLKRYKDEDYKFPWEKGYIESMDDFVLKIKIPYQHEILIEALLISVAIYYCCYVRTLVFPFFYNYTRRHK